MGSTPSPEPALVFQVLLASGPQAPPAPGRFLLAVGVHAGVIAAAIVLSRHPATPVSRRPPGPAILYVAPVAHPSVAIPPAPGPRAPLPQISQPELSRPEVNVPVLPATVPSVADLLSNGAIRSGPRLASGPGGAPSTTSEAFTAAMVDDAVEILEQPPPQYPPALAQAGLTGRVELTYVVDTLGVAEAGSLRALTSTHPAFESAARASVLATRYRPARLRGRAVRQLVRQSFSFRTRE